MVVHSHIQVVHSFQNVYVNLLTVCILHDRGLTWTFLGGGGTGCLLVPIGAYWVSIIVFKIAVVSLATLIINLINFLPSLGSRENH